MGVRDGVTQLMSAISARALKTDVHLMNARQSWYPVTQLAAPACLSTGEYAIRRNVILSLSAAS